MRLVTFVHEGRARAGALIGADAEACRGRVLDLAAAGRRLAKRTGRASALAPAGDVLAVLAAGERARTEAAEALARAGELGEGCVLDLARVRLLAPIPRPPKIVCMARNYAEHVKEGGDRPLPERPVLFSKFPANVIGPGEAIVLPRVSSMVDYEGELAVVIGRPGRYVAEADALAHVAGYMVANDVSARDFQKATSQIMVGKSFDTFAPLGPALVTADEVPDPQALKLRTLVDGEVRQETSTGEMIFPIRAIIAHVSQVWTLEVGEVLLTGTPAGVGFWRKPQVFLKPGQRVRVEIDGLGALENPTVAEG
ncbi:MAG: fumarylacetoacetate hydrolase family protein [Proteobacteria bacterium]|nr:fumarylacetoacetate hydrolase family protein [Pseudomonadota bacterium]